MCGFCFCCCCRSCPAWVSFLLARKDFHGDLLALDEARVLQVCHAVVLFDLLALTHDLAPHNVQLLVVLVIIISVFFYLPVFKSDLRVSAVDGIGGDAEPLRLFRQQL